MKSSGALKYIQKLHTNCAAKDKKLLSQLRNIRFHGQCYIAKLPFIKDTSTPLISLNI